jgi:AraC-like DNA-binding protein
MERRPLPDQSDDTRLWGAEALGGLELLRARLVEFSFSPHAHQEYVIILTESGAARPRFWGGPQPLGRGDIFVLNPEVVHSGGPAAGSAWRYRSFYVPADLMRRAVRELTGDERGLPRFPREVFSDPHLMALLWQAHVALEEPPAPGAGSMLERESRLLEALAGLVACHAEGKPQPGRLGREHRAVGRVREYLEARPGENVSLDRLAQEAGLSPYYLCRVFRRETGLSPHAYQVLARLRLAKALLAEGVPISDAALEAGFFDQAHLTRHFKRVFGVTPGRYAG